MIALSVAEVAEIVGAAVGGPAAGPDGAARERAVLDVVVDSRAVRPGSLFVALPGERVDGHDFVGTALARGAVAAVTARELPEQAGSCLVVDDPVAALGRLGRAVVDSATAGGLAVAAVTGSQGKTSTKDLLAQVLERAGSTVAPYGNLNNELGVPLTATRVDAGTRFLVVEMGARGVGHIAYLCGITPPRVGVVLNVGYAHVGEFGSQQAIARAKGELVEALPADGVAVLNADDPLVWAMRSRTVAPVTGFSVRGRPETDRAVWATDVSSDALGRCRFRLHADTTGVAVEADVSLTLSGRHHVPNAVAAAAAATALGLDLASVADALTAAGLRSRGRMEMHHRDDDVLVIDDAYNANPDSCRAAVDTLAEVGRARRTDRAGGRTWAVLGDMLELGESAVDEHTALGRHVARVGIDRLVAVGEHAGALARGAASAGLAADRTVVLGAKATAAGHVLPYLLPGDTVLVKASRGLALDTVAEEIWSAPPPEQSPPARPEHVAHREDPA